MTALLVYFLGPAHACGGLFCSSTPSISTPIAQNAERIVFEVGDGYVDAHVQVFYEGPAEEFAWVVPVPAEPELFPSQEALFDRLVATTAPTFRLDDFTRDGCSRPVRIGCSREAGIRSFVPPAPDGGVGIVNEAEVGPYETLTLEASDSRALIRFLQDAGYDLPLALAEVLAPYVADGGYFVALRLAKHRDVGDIEPLGMRYAGSQPSIPITLTSIAATDAMPVEVYVFGDHRAVPTSYLHVEINEALVDWWSGAANYYDVVGQAVDEAGGHAFVTDYFGEPPSRGRRLRWNVNVDNLLAQDRLGLWLDVVTVGGVELDAHAAGVIARAVGAPGDVDPVEFVDCPSCFGWDDEDFDSEALTLAFYDEVLVYLERIEQMFDRPRLTRLITTLDAAEMTIDPMFAMNADLSGSDQFVTGTRGATYVTDCTSELDFARGSQVLTLDDGTFVGLPRASRLPAGTEAAYIASLGLPAARRIVQHGESGPGTVLVDESVVDAAIEAHNRTLRGVLGGACATDPSRAGLPMAMVLALSLLRRRRRSR